MIDELGKQNNVSQWGILSNALNAQIIFWIVKKIENKLT